MRKKLVLFSLLVLLIVVEDDCGWETKMAGWGFSLVFWVREFSLRWGFCWWEVALVRGSGGGTPPKAAMAAHAQTK